MNQYQQYIALSRYARWLPKENRRETWEETVDRYMINVVSDKVGGKLYNKLKHNILNLNLVPSMRAMMCAGPAMERDNTCAYNCAYLAVDDPKAFDEALRQLISLLYAGEVPKWNMSKVRPAGAKLKTFGGRASGPGPLEDLFNFTCETFEAAKGRKLSSIQAHDLMTKIGEVVVVGGVRRSAMISLSNLSDDRMRHAKSGDWYVLNPQRALANNSVAYTEKPDMETFLREWTSLVESKSGERGIFSRVAAKKQVAKNGRRDPDHEWGCNPCSEILLRPNQFCNLTEVVARHDDNLETLTEKVELATILGTIQATYTKFPYLRKIWQKNTEEERLLGVSMTGIMDNKLISTDKNAGELLEKLKNVAIETNEIYAKKFDIPVSAAITCVKPSGTVSQLVDSASGIHTRHSNYYIRTVRGDTKDPLTQFLINAGVPSEPCVMKPDNTVVFSFPTKSPKGAITRDDLDAIQQLEIWLMYQRSWCEHKPSVTITVREHEWMQVGAWVYDNFDEMSGVSFLPHSDHSYKQAPYQEILKEEYEEAVEKMPIDIDWAYLSDYEKEDTTVSSQTLACSGDSCEIVDIGA